jgi:hypothetical protein
LVVHARGPLAHAELIETLEGTMRAEVGDYVIKGARGELYPIKGDIFRETYEVLSPGDELRALDD